MERFAWRGRILEGTQEEYKRRHREIWPEMQSSLRQAGIRNYTIWISGLELFGYYECEKGTAYAAGYQANDPVVARWEEYMKDILVLDIDPATGVSHKLEQVFLLE